MSALDQLTVRPGAVSTAPAVLSISKPTLILCAKQLQPREQAIFGEFGNVVVWSDKYLNVPLDKITPFDYLIIDMNSKNARLTLGRTDLAQYNVVSYVSVIQKIEDFVEQVGGTVITSVPTEAVNKADFDLMLQSEKLISPSLLKSVFKWALTCLKK